MNKENIACFIGRCWSCMKMGNNESAWEDADSAVTLDPSNDDAMLFRAMASHNLGNLDAALQYGPMCSLFVNCA